jgi:Trk K+ transport system NAD-binding subunit
MIIYSHRLYDKLAPWLGWFERRTPFRELAVSAQNQDVREADVVVIGLGRYGSQLAFKLRASGLSVLGVEFDPEAARQMRSQNMPVRYGDATTSEFLESLPLKQTPWLVSTLPDLNANRDLLRSLRELNYPGEVALVVRHEGDSDAFQQLGASQLLYPMRNAIDYAAEVLSTLIPRKTESNEKR